MAFGVLLALLFVASSILGGETATFTITNNCPYTIWPATLTSGGGAISSSGFALASHASNALTSPASWSGRIWARAFCNDAGTSCATGDCGNLQCSAGGAPPATLIEFTLNGDGGKDFYDVSLVDGFNLPVTVSPKGGGCSQTSCPVDINAACPNDLALKNQGGATIGCKSACLAFNQPQYCCTGAYNSPGTCKPTNYSQFFKGKCPQAYSYAFDDKTSTFTCPTGSDYVVTFCP
ncbi:Thaumatin-like protein/pathogenesis related protein-5 [Heracleum sosnowskyi]|uniref:Thaumatin-like protein/pathogenesis related protein-5 n=1 Tax=Heracleum sosnowskyi TaxID=360622 RepID=A0AAD8MV91_9APIA|nr:Thaumatin-like protein/pathogenesis related protein-5 [Heracleum sosnowskyi]